jgi:hypothetical protein
MWVEVDVPPGKQVALLVIAVAKDLLVAVKAFTTKPAPEAVAEIALAESEVVADAVRCLRTL